MEGSTGCSSSSVHVNPAVPDDDTRLIMTVRNRIQRPPGRIYSCIFCTKTFGNAQALGGHQNTHKREREQQMRDYDARRKGRMLPSVNRRPASRDEELLAPKCHSALPPSLGPVIGHTLDGAPIYGPTPLMAYGPPAEPHHGYAARFETGFAHGPPFYVGRETMEDESAGRAMLFRQRPMTRDFLGGAHLEENDHHDGENLPEKVIDENKDDASQVSQTSMNKMQVPDVEPNLDLTLGL